MKYFEFLILIAIITLINCNPKHITPSSTANIHNSKLLDSNSEVEYDFPKDWLGYWSGELKIYSATGLKQMVPMSLDLNSTDTSGIYTWAIIYGSDSTDQRREYQLQEVDTTNGHYLIDEKNGILLDAYHIHNELISVFEVMGNNIITTYALENQEIVFSVKMYPSKEKRISGDTLILDQEIPKVSSYQMKVSQVARLQKNALSNRSNNKAI